jgi:lipopolysaccharide transport system permease protein
MNDQSKAITRITPKGSFFDLGWGELWAHRELLYFLALRDIKIRYKQTAIGVAWALLQPVLTTAIFTVIFSTLARFDSAGVPYPLFALSGLMIWLYVNSSITTASASFISNTNLVTKVYFPRILMPVAPTLAGLADLVFSILVLIPLMAYYSVGFNWQMMLAPVFLVFAILLAASVGVLFAALNVRFRDVKFALPFILQVWMFISPIFYPLDILPEKARMVFIFNPLTGILHGFRASLFGEKFDWFAIGVSVVMTLAVMIVSIFTFKQMEDDFADLI